MAVKIRLRRMGATKAPFYRIVVADSRYPRDGRFIEEIGTYNPLTDPAEINIDAEKVQKWIKNGAQPTDIVRKLLKKAVFKRKFGLIFMKELLEFIAKSLVENPAEVTVTQIENDTSIILELRVAQGDTGKVIGRQGKIAKAIRTVVRSAASKEKKKIIVDII